MITVFFIWKCPYRDKPLLLIGWAASRLLSIPCPSAQMTMSFCITYPTSCKCPTPLSNGWTSPNWATGTVKWHKNDKHILSLFYAYPCCWVICFHSALPFILLWSSICCTPWCLPWTPDFLKRQRTFLWLWVTLKRLAEYATEEIKTGPVNWLVSVTSLYFGLPPGSSSLETLCAGNWERIWLSSHTSSQWSDSTEGGGETSWDLMNSIERKGSVW